MTETEYFVTSGSEADADGLEKVHSGLEAYNEAHTGPVGFKKVGLLVRDSAGDVKAGLIGKHIWGWLRIETLWVEESVRGKGLGSRLLAQAEAEAKEAGCTRALLDTFEFQAPGFYEKQGYSRFAVLEEFPPGSRLYYLQKELGA